MHVVYAQKAAAQLAALPADIQKRIAKKMRFYAAQEEPLRFAKRLTDYREGDFAFRVGMYRLTFDVVQNIIYILKVEKRDKSYD